MENETEIEPEILAMSDGQMLFELTGDPEWLTDDELLAELTE